MFYFFLVPDASAADSVRDGNEHPMREEVAPAVLGGGNKAADVGPFPEAVAELKVDEDSGLLPMVVRTFSPLLSPNPLADLPPQCTPFAEVQPVEENFNKLAEQLTNLMGNVEKVSARFGEVDCKVQVSLPQVGRNQGGKRALSARVRQLEMCKDTLPEFSHTQFNIRITDFERYLVWHGLQRTITPTPSILPPTWTSHSSSAPSVQ